MNDLWKLYFFRAFREMHFFGAISVPYFLDWIGANYTQLFLVEAWFLAWIFLLEVPTGVIADKYGRKASMLAGLCASLSSLVLFSITQSYGVLYLAEFLGALGIALMSGADKALLYDKIMHKEPKERRKILAKYDTAATIGIIIALPIGAAVASINYPNNLPTAFLMTAGGVVLAIAMVAAIREGRKHVPIENPVLSGIKGFKHIFREKKLAPLAFNSVLIGGFTFFNFWLYQPIIQEAGLPLYIAGIVGASFNILGLILLTNIERIERLTTMPTLLLLTAIIPGIFFIVMAFTNIVGIVIFSIMAIAGLRALRQPILVDYMNRHITSTNRATVLSGISMLERIVIAIMYPIIGLVSDISLHYALLVLGVATVAFAFITRLETSHLDG